MSRIEWMLGGVLTLIMMIIGGMLVVTWFQPVMGAAPAEVALQPQPTSAYAGRPAQTAFASALQEAVAWDAGARLSAATATWLPGSDFSSGEATWSFTFYSPDRQQIALISVVEDDAKLVSHRQTAQPLPTMDPSAWPVDSQAVVGALLNGGGGAFLAANTDVTMVLTLNAGETPTWDAVLFSPVSGQSFNQTISAVTGEPYQPVPKAAEGLAKE